MKKLLIITLFCFLIMHAKGQNTNSEVPLKDLAVPNSAAFILVDAATSNIESPTNSKEFVLGLVQNFNLDSKWFQNYSLEFAPYWWFKPSNRSIYTFAGLKPADKNNSRKEDIFSGLKFTNISLAMVGKDLIPDTIKLEQKIISFGIRTTLIKVHQRDYVKKIDDEIKNWHTAAQAELDALQEQIFNETDPVKKKALLKKYANAKPEVSTKTAAKISDLINAKPIFSWDLAGAFSEYGVGDSVWKSGRVGAWTTLSSYLPLFKDTTYKNYFDILLSARYMHDNYVKKDDNTISASGSFDIGGKVGFEIQRFSLFAEGMYRKASVNKDWEKRIVGIVNYKVQDNIYITGTYGNDFGPEKKIVALFGVNWGFGAEKAEMKDAK
jgi:hypothetical protein